MTDKTNLAASLARAGQRVIIVDCELLRPTVHEAFGLPNEQGFTSVLLDQCSLADAITTLDGEPNLVVLTAGPTPPNPTELLASERAKAIIRTLREFCDILLIEGEGPPSSSGGGRPPSEGDGPTSGDGARGKPVGPPNKGGHLAKSEPEPDRQTAGRTGPGPTGTRSSRMKAGTR